MNIAEDKDRSYQSGFASIAAKKIGKRLMNALASVKGMPRCDNKSASALMFCKESFL
jgi:hypothetical protein